MISEATEVCREILYFEYPSKSVPLNRPTRVWAFDAERSRVELTAEALQIGRPLT